MDNIYSSPILFLKLRVKEDTSATGTLHPRKGVPKEVLNAKFKTRGKHKKLLYEKLVVVIRIMDRKHVNLLSTGHNYKLVSTGKRHYQTREILSTTRIVYEYNKYMGVDWNDQVLKYSAFNKRSAKWWKKLLFRLLNVGMVNAYMVNAHICYKEWMSQHCTRQINQTDFRTQCINQMDNSVDNLNSAKSRSVNPINIKRLTEQHFVQKIVVTGQKS